MRRLSFLILLFSLAVNLAAQSTHGDSFQLECSRCHNLEGWIPLKPILDFDHNSTQFELIGEHQKTTCTDCHTDLIFANARQECISCHQDIHDNTLGPDCDRCHTPKTWIIQNISDLHRETRFPLLGAHSITDCKECHTSILNLLFEPLSTECVDCHLEDYNSTKDPNNHQILNYSKSCTDCHSARAIEWGAADFEHSFFPLAGGHTIRCEDCHTDGTYQKIPRDCFVCHQKDYEGTTSIDHSLLGFSNDCSECHTTNPEWKPAEFKSHDDRFFPIFSGKHNNEWNDCQDCHLQPKNYTIFSCTDCHAHGRLAMDLTHNDERGYEYVSLSCFGCHPTGRGEGDFNHSNTDFPLVGEHRSVSCRDCHIDQYGGLSTLCQDCHDEDYRKSEDPEHQSAGLPMDCSTCHSANGWTPSSFDHTTTGYVLEGGHLRIQQCADCHKGTVVETQSECMACHDVQYNEAEKHKEESYPVDCLLCHNSNTWEDANFDHDATNFPLTGKHKGEECASCHQDVFQGTPNLCKDCHNDNYQSANEPKHTEAGIPDECETCHTAEGWKPSLFDHTATGFVLDGGHLRIQQCADCHKGTVVNTPSTCISCHQAQYDAAPGHKDQNFPTDCTLCHTKENWLDAQFDHAATNFPLTGQHITVQCIECHTAGFTGTPAECNACHNTNYLNAQIPNHTAAGIPLLCESCHTPDGWKPSSFDHGTTGFILEGGHLRVQQCSECHSGTLVNTPNECISCHQIQYNGAPGHLEQAFPFDCNLCHNKENWEDAQFDHSQTEFPLNGQHVRVECAACHANGYSGTPNQCNACHNDKYISAQDPRHSSAGLPLECEICHNSQAWTPSIFDHANTGFLLEGGHLQIQQCADCHKGSLINTPNECISCHQAQYDGAPGHKDQTFPFDCTLCHNKNNWEDANFDHSATNFTLTGQHVSVDCAECHTNGYSGTPDQCNDCHNGDYLAAQEPGHTAAGIPTACESCHTPSGWSSSSFDHTSTGFVLEGGHLRIQQCSDCHKGTLVNTPNECISCHQTQYNSATGHLAQSYPLDCTICHNKNNWLDANFDHSITNFPLVGLHQTVQCARCHTNGFTGTPDQCNDCHNDNYISAQDPSHTAAGITTNCEICHTPSGWSPSSFSHSTTGFSLTGAHQNVPQCSACHKGTLTGASDACYSCHATEYNAATNPSHTAAQFPTTCEDCHSTSAWTPSTFDHDGSYFPIYSGEHRGEWNSCTDCHTTPGNYSLFSCIDCHEHNRTEMDQEHQGVNNYSYNSAACYNCHPNGKGVF